MSTKSSTVVSAVLLVTRVGGTAVSGAGALLELERPAVAELPAVASISKSSSGSGLALFLLGVSTSIGASLFIEAGGTNFENSAVLLLVLVLVLLVVASPPLCCFDVCSDSLAVYSVLRWRARSTLCRPVLDCNSKGSMRDLHASLWCASPGRPLRTRLHPGHPGV